ncbi:hypothetical protein ACIQMV_15080 [Streptomyces sp. NPDC091412]|uniref:hypothetical protein n=1 Tax=Streptomyces sp. NPDC091412 TaxID=3366002 RepID=UPI0037F73495
MRTGRGPENMATFRNLAIGTLREAGYRYIPDGLRDVSHRPCWASADLQRRTSTPTLNQPWLVDGPEVFTDDGQVTNSDTEQFLTRFMEEFRDHIVRVLSVLTPRNT